MRPYAKTTDHPAFIADSHHRNRRYRYRRSHRIPRDQALRREQRSAARAEEREIIRAELAAYREEQRTEESEQAAAYLMAGITEPAIPHFITYLEEYDAPYWEEESEALDKLSDEFWADFEAEQDSIGSYADEDW